MNFEDALNETYAIYGPGCDDRGDTYTSCSPPQEVTGWELLKRAQYARSTAARFTEAANNMFSILEGRNG